MPEAAPAWLDRGEYPFQPRYLDLPAGRMHYVDEGEGQPVLFVHGTPTWSFLWRHLIRGLSRRFRCVAPDHLGFGLSGRPAGWPGGPADHAANLKLLVERLDLRGPHLAVHDFGGPIGLSYALDRPDNVGKLVLFNTWMWPTRDNPARARLARILGSGFGRFLYERLNFSAGQLLPRAFGDRSKLTSAIHRQYLSAQDPAARHYAWILARELLASDPWYADLWARREALRDKPALLLWGMRDLAFGAGDLRRWEGVFARRLVERFPRAGHFPQEEIAGDLVQLVEGFLEDPRAPRAA